MSVWCFIAVLSFPEKILINYCTPLYILGKKVQSGLSFKEPFMPKKVLYIMRNVINDCIIFNVEQVISVSSTDKVFTSFLIQKM